MHRLLHGGVLAAAEVLWLDEALVAVGIVVFVASLAVAAPRRLSPRVSAAAIAVALIVLGILAVQALQGSGPIVYGNWAGYVAAGDEFTAATASWTEPAIPASRAPTAVALWVGLDGEQDTPVEQIGTECSSEHGLVSYDAWYEMYPEPMVPIRMVVHPGDVLTGTVTSSAPDRYTLRLVNDTTGASFTTRQAGRPAARSSAEVVAETPYDKESRLADFGAVRFSGCRFNGLAIGSCVAHSLDITTDRHLVEAATSALGADGSSFTVRSSPALAASGGVWREVSVMLSFHDVAGVRLLCALSLAYVVWLGLLRLSLQRTSRQSRRVRGLLALPGLVAPAVVVATGVVRFAHAWSYSESLPSELRGIRMAGTEAADARLLAAATIVWIGLALCLAPLAVTLPRRLPTWLGAVAVAVGVAGLVLMLGHALGARVHGSFDLAVFASLAYTSVLGLTRLQGQRRGPTRARTSHPRASTIGTGPPVDPA